MRRLVRISHQNHLLVVSRQSGVPGVMKNLSGRGQIGNFSKSSAQRMGRYLRTCSADYINMVTLTYPHGYPRDGLVFKNHLRRFLQELKRSTSRDGGIVAGTGYRDYSVFWFMEFQERGAAHFHLFTTHYYDKYWVAKKWFDIVGSDDDRHLRAGTRIEKIRSGRHGTCAYAGKYAAKSEQKIVPEWVKNAGRFWGVSGSRKTVAADTVLDEACLNDPKVSLKLKTLKTWLKEKVKSGAISMIGVGTTKCFYIKNSFHLKELQSMLATLNMAVALSGNGGAIWDFTEREGGYSIADSLHKKAKSDESEGVYRK